MKKTIKNKVLASLIITCALGFGTPAHAETQTVDRVEAVVNNGVILESDLNAAFIKYKKHIQSNTPKGQEIPDDHTIKKQVLEQLIWVYRSVIWKQISLSNLLPKCPTEL